MYSIARQSFHLLKVEEKHTSVFSLMQQFTFSWSRVSHFAPHGISYKQTENQGSVEIF